MGEAKNRKLAAEKVAGAIEAVKPEEVFRAVRQTMDALSNLSGVDCLWFSLVGAGLLKHLGVPARAVAGHASWRVGPGDGDMVVHDPSVTPAAVYVPSGQAVMFHAWIELDSPNGLKVIDFTTFQLQDKAAALDAADGGKTQVDFCPDFIWQDAPIRSMSTQEVAQAPDAGVYSYKRVKEVEAQVFQTQDHEDIERAVQAAIFVHGKIKLNEHVRVVGFDMETGEAQVEAPKLRNSRRP